MPEFGLSLGALVAANVVMSIGCALQASIGMGLALLAVPLLALLSPQLVPGPMLLAGSLLAVACAYRERHAVEASAFAVCMVGLIAGTVFGAMALAGMAGAHLETLFAILVLGAVAVSVLRFRLRPTRWALLAGSTAAGLMGTMVGIHGPPIALALQNAHPEHARAMLGAFFFVAFLASVAALAAAGLFGMQQLRLAACLLPGVAAGLFLAPPLARLISPARMRAAILAGSCASALLLLLR